MTIPRTRLFALCLVTILHGCGAAAPPAGSSPAQATGSGPIRNVILVTIDGLPPAAYLEADAHGLLWGDALTVHPREVFAVERCPDAGPDLCGPGPMNS